FGILSIFLVLIFSNIKASDSAKEDWDLAKRSKGVSIYYRWVTLSDTLKAREMRAVFIINAKISSIVPLFQSPGSFKKWAIGIKKCQMETVNDSHWITYSMMNYPWPFKQKDLVTESSVEESAKMTCIQIKAIPDRVAEKPGIERLKNYLGTWNFSTMKDGRTTVEYRVMVYSKPVFPRFIQDPLIIKLSIQSLVDLKHLAENL
ncbi:MAG TPA: hypothetical protein VKA38_03680, partial [Draconibacterium sp.]|nr:hypothetical protein [Draconibacterium sp.]